MIQNKEGGCRNCVFFQPHDTYDYFGICIAQKDLIIKKVSKEACGEYKEHDLEALQNVLLRRGWLYCFTCKKIIYTLKELVDHLDDQLASNFFSDLVASEEAPVAD